MIGRKRTATALFVALGGTMLPVLLAGCGNNPQASAEPLGIRGNAQHGKRLIAQFGCGSCHLIPGVENADALVGPPLNSWRKRVYIAGLLRNTPDNLQRWIQHPQQIVPNNAMPDMGISDEQAQDIAAYLYTLR
jgi:cytochrome c2